MYVCVCMYICMCTYVCVRKYVSLCIYVCIHVRICVYVYIHAYVCMRVYMYVYIHAFVCTCVCICMTRNFIVRVTPYSRDYTNGLLWYRLSHTHTMHTTGTTPCRQNRYCKIITKHPYKHSTSVTKHEKPCILSFEVVSITKGANIYQTGQMSHSHLIMPLGYVGGTELQTR